MRKVKEFHLQLISKVEKEEEVVGSTASPLVSPVIGGDDAQFASKLEEHRLDREQFKKKREEVMDLRTKKQRILRSTTENAVRLQQLEEKVREYRNIIREQQEATQKVPLRCSQYRQCTFRKRTAQGTPILTCWVSHRLVPFPV